MVLFGKLSVHRKIVGGFTVLLSLFVHGHLFTRLDLQLGNLLELQVR